MADNTTPVTPTPLVLPRLSTVTTIVDPQSSIPTGSFVQTINNAFSNIATAFAALLAQETATGSLAQSNASILQQLLDQAGLITDLNGKLVSVSITNSYTNPSSVLTATTTGSTTLTSTITIAAHERLYTDGMSVAVNGGSISGLAANTTYYIYYNDPTRAGGAVSYMSSTNINDAAQIGGIHSVGAITTPASSTDAPSSGAGSNPPGVVHPSPGTSAP